MAAPVPSSVVVMLRALFRRCPLCGARPIFDSWFRLKTACPRCSFNFEREPGWWIGGMIINTGASIALFGLVLGLGILLFWPRVPWTAISVIGIAAMAIFPIVFYPMSKTLWLGVDLLMTGMDPDARK
ncbi:MAG: DUF983 domain-containing protein [Actinobacteria bacterium]|nr:DUF983 domain-containing protein [Actinomycetota bacterium]